MMNYSQISEHRALYELPMARGFALLNVARRHAFGVELDSTGYIGQELDRITP